MTETDTDTDLTTPVNGDAAPQRTRAEERADAVRTPSRAELAERIEQLEERIADAERRADQHLASWQRAAADLANFRRRTESERADFAQFSNVLLIGKLLSVLDDFDRALDNVPAELRGQPWIEGVRLVERKLRSVLEAEGLEPVPAAGVEFDPNIHEAVVHEETSDHPDNHVIAELQRGYRLRDRVIRPALVKVANNPDKRN
jgi:molecular chaperone GrpE